MKAYIPSALAEYEVYETFKHFWVERTPDRLPLGTSLPDALALLEKHGYSFRSAEGLVAPKPKNLMTLEEVTMLRKSSPSQIG